MIASLPVSKQPLPFLTGDKDEAENKSGNNGLNTETSNHKLPHTSITTSGDEIVSEGSDKDAIQVDPTSVYPTRVWGSPQSLEEEKLTNT